MRFSKAIVRRPCRAMIHGLTGVDLGTPDYAKALCQHDRYIETLELCGLDVIVLEADEKYPDSVFVEDTALLTPRCALITYPGAVSRRGEIFEIAAVVRNYYDKIEYIRPPATVDAGDIMMVGDHFYIGVSARTNEHGADQVVGILRQHGLTGSTVPVDQILHLKAGAAYIENSNLVAGSDFAGVGEFRRFNIIEVDKEEAYAANCVWINGKVLVADGFPRTRSMIEAAGYETIVLDVSEFRKLDGGLSCLSLRF